LLPLTEKDQKLLRIAHDRLVEKGYQTESVLDYFARAYSIIYMWEAGMTLDIRSEELSGKIEQN
jgi:hypothetical protein